MAELARALLERLADLEHRQWSVWASSVMEHEELSRERVARWSTLVGTAYDDLPEQHKELAREFARLSLWAISEAIADFVEARAAVYEESSAEGARRLVRQIAFDLRTIIEGASGGG